jgi:hypothetical protein
MIGSGVIERNPGTTNRHIHFADLPQTVARLSSDERPIVSGLTSIQGVLDGLGIQACRSDALKPARLDILRVR